MLIVFVLNTNRFIVKNNFFFTLLTASLFSSSSLQRHSTALEINNYAIDLDY